jgi:ADP-ribose pyrophosphatase YjhB (NUDIX family)
MRTIYKVRALVTDQAGGALAIEADADHVLQLPGGSRKAKEPRRAALRRELWEELGHTVRIQRKAATVEVQRNGVREVTDFYLVQVKGGKGKPQLTGRELARGLRVTRYESAKALRKELKQRVRQFGRSAAARDLRLVSLAV